MEYSVSGNMALEIVVDDKEINIINSTGGNSVTTGGVASRIYGVVDSNGNKVAKPNHMFIEANTPTISTSKIDISTGSEVTINLKTKLMGL